MKLQNENGVIKEVDKRLVADYKSAGWKKVVKEKTSNTEIYENKNGKNTKEIKK